MQLLLVTTFLSVLSAGLSFIITPLMSLFNRPTPKERDLHKQLVELNRQLAKIPMVDNFVAHAKVQRKFNAIEGDLKAETNKRLTNNVKYKIFIPYSLQAVITVIIFYIVMWYSHVPVIVLDNFNFFPVSNIISYPNERKGAVSVHCWLMASNVVVRYMLKL